ncbi:MAG: energy transducer TonB [Spirosomataceae bacterium]|jgi:protein TonB
MKYLFCLFFSTFYVTVLAQSIDSTKQEMSIYHFTDGAPKFPDGTSAMYKWIVKNLKYPEEAFNKRIQGKVYVKFVIEADGSVSKPNVLKRVYEELYEEACRIICSFPKWQPATLSGKPVRTYFTMPITFKLK